MILRISMKLLERDKRKNLKNKVITMMKIRKNFICQLKGIKITIIKVIMRHLKLLHQFSREVNY